MQHKQVLAMTMALMSSLAFAKTPAAPKKAKAPVVEKASAPEDLTKKLVIPYETYQLPNGLTVILSKDQKSPFAAVSVWYQVGSINEDIENNKTGLAHLFEHLMFEGSRHVPASEHFRKLESAGAVDINASTNFDRTNYFQTVPKNFLELVLAYEASRMAFLVIDQPKLDEQRAVVRREREQRFEVAPYGLTTLALWEKIFPQSNPMHGRVIGSHADLEAVKLNDVQAFYDRFYGPSNASIAVVGDIDMDKTKALIAKYFGTLPKTPAIQTPKLPPVVLGDEEILTLEEKIGKLPLVRIQYVTPGLFQPGDAELDLISHILTGGENARLTKAVTRDKMLASSVAAYQQSLEQVSVFTIDATVNPGVDPKQLINEIDTVLVELAKNGPTPLEINRARNSVLTDQLFGLQELGGYSGRAELLQTYFRYAKTPGYIQHDVKRYQVVDQNACKKTAATYLPVKTARKILIATPVLHKVALQGK